MKKRKNKFSIIFLSLWFIAIQFSCSPSYLKTGTYWAHNGKRLTLKEDSTYRYYRLSYGGIDWNTSGSWRIEGNKLILKEEKREDGVLGIFLETIETDKDAYGVFINSNLPEQHVEIFLSVFFDNELVKELDGNQYSYNAEVFPKEVLLVAKNDLCYARNPVRRELTSKKILLDTITEGAYWVKIYVEISHDDFWRVSQGDMLYFLKSKRKFKSPENTFRWINPRRK